MPTEHECGRLMGFPKDFVIPVARTYAFRQFGKAVVVSVVEHVASAALDWLEANELGDDSRSQGAAKPVGVGLVRSLRRLPMPAEHPGRVRP